MRLIASLGNPSPKYDGTRHNLGHYCVAKWIETVSASPINVPRVKQGVYTADINGEKTIIANDLGTYMNETGSVITAVLNFYKIPTKNLILVHDDADLPLGTLRVSKNSASAGHHGVESVISALGTKNFTRLRLGIESRSDKSTPSTEDFVLQKFSSTEIPTIEGLVARGAMALNAILQHGLERAMSEYSRTGPVLTKNN